MKEAEVIKRMIARYEMEERVQKFRDWRKLVRAFPDRYRIRMVKFNDGVAFALEVFATSRRRHTTLFRHGECLDKLSPGPTGYDVFNKAGWDIVDNTELWKTGEHEGQF